MRRALAPLVLTLVATGCFVPKDQDKTTSDTRCTSCHGSASNPGDLTQQAAPPSDTHGNTDPSVPGVGAHQRHLLASATHAAIACTECHVVPKAVGDKGHDDHAGPATLTFGPLATEDGGLTPVYNQVTYGCANTYCHQAATVDWTKQRTEAEACGTCHGLPPPAPHPQATECSVCHAAVVDAQLKIIAPELHVNGKIDVSSATCNACHGGPSSAAPPVGVDGGTATTGRGVGAHTAHLTSSTKHRDVLCSDCHKVPSSITSAGHANGTVEVQFASVAGVGPRDGGAAYDASNATCTTWCHTPNPGSAPSPTWTRQGSALGCTDCHGLPPPAPHPQSTHCSECHLNSVGLGFADKTLHINGIVEVRSLSAGCSSCHGSAANAAPPQDTDGNTDTTLPSVGAHQVHLNPTLGRPVPCGECHVVPTEFDSAGHLDGTVQVSFSGVATDFGTAASFDGTANTCTVYCHNPVVFGGGSPTGGTQITPLWTKVDGSQKTCVSCHGLPPPLPHVQRADCGTCHQDFSTTTGALIRPELHIDGVVTLDVLH